MKVCGMHPHTVALRDAMLNAIYPKRDGSQEVGFVSDMQTDNVALVGGGGGGGGGAGSAGGAGVLAVPVCWRCRCVGGAGVLLVLVLVLGVQRYLSEAGRRAGGEFSLSGM